MAAKVVVAATSNTTPPTTAEIGDLDGPGRLVRFRSDGLALMWRRRSGTASVACGDYGENTSLRQITTDPSAHFLGPAIVPGMQEAIMDDLRIHVKLGAWCLASVPACAPRVRTLKQSARTAVQLSSGARCPTLTHAFRSTRHCLLWNALAGLRARTISRRNTGRTNRELWSRDWLPAGPSSGFSQSGGDKLRSPRKPAPVTRAGAPPASRAC